MRATRVVTAGLWDTTREVDRVLIDFDRRFRRRILLRTEADDELLLDLPRAVRLRHDDGLMLEDGAMVRVCAQPEPVMSITAGDELLLLRMAWHLGNRHLPVQVLPGELRILADHVIQDMIEGLGGSVLEVFERFDPEPGAYDSAPPHMHDDDDD
jgi:urease accessory protein